MQGQPNLNCKQMEEALDAYYDLELSPEEAEAVDEHLASCAACADKLADIDMVVSKLKTLPAVEWNGDLSDAIEARILAQSAAPNLDSKPASTESAVANNVIPISSASKFRLKPRYILASAASILALFFAYSQFVPHTASHVEIAQSPTVSTAPQVATTNNQVKQVEQIEQVESPPVASLPDKKAPLLAPENSIETNKSTPVKVANLPASKEPAKVRVESTTEKMLANSELGKERDSNNNKVNDSEEIVAVYDYDTIDSASDFGISTNEDGLYAIKL